jgi:hypothetical protein
MKLWVGQVIKGQDDLDGLCHRPGFHAGGKLFRSFVVLRIDLATGGHGARHQFRTVAGARRHIEHAPSGPRSDERQKFLRLAFLIVLPVSFRAGPARREG